MALYGHSGLSSMETSSGLMAISSAPPGSIYNAQTTLLYNARISNARISNNLSFSSNNSFFKNYASTASWSTTSDISISSAKISARTSPSPALPFLPLLGFWKGGNTATGVNPETKAKERAKVGISRLLGRAPPPANNPPEDCTGAVADWKWNKEV